MVEWAPQHLQDVRTGRERQLRDIVGEQLQYRYEGYLRLPGPALEMIVALRPVAHRPRLAGRPQQGAAQGTLLHGWRTGTGVQPHRCPRERRNRRETRGHVNPSRYRGVHNDDRTAPPTR